MKVSYRVSTEFPEGCLFRHIEDERGSDCQQWSVVKNEWVPSESACAAFIGFESSIEVDEAEAKRIIREDAARYANEKK